MKTYSALQIGDYHLNNCEDYLFIGDIGNDKILCAVMDGCTMGTDSYFVSTLTGKLLRKIAKEKGIPWANPIFRMREAGNSFGR